MPGGGVKGCFSHGETDEHGYEAITGTVHIHDWRATVLHLLGFDHAKLTYRFGGPNMRLTDLYGSVARKILS